MDIHSLRKRKVSHAFPLHHGSRAAVRLRQCCDACLCAPCSTSLSLPFWLSLSSVQVLGYLGMPGEKQLLDTSRWCLSWAPPTQR